MLPLIFLSRFILRHICDFQPSYDDSSPPNPMLKFISDKYQFQFLRELWSSIVVSNHYGRTWLEREGSHVMEVERGGK